MHPSIDLKPTFEFLNLLKENNNREWFNANKNLYEASHMNLIEFSDQLLDKMRGHDQIETQSGKKSLFRIYRDTRFSKDKTPYKTNWGGGYKRATQALRGGYYFQIQPGNTFVAGGFWGPNAQDLLHIRKQIAQDDSELRSITGSKSFKKYFETIIGDQVKTAPKGFAKDHPSIDLLKFKQFILKHSFDDSDALKPDFTDKMNEAFKQMRPFFDYMSEILTTDLNGTPLISN